MNQATQTEKLKHEVSLLRSAVVGLLLRDREGEYKKSFVTATQKAAVRNPSKTYKGGKAFLDELSKI